MSIESTVDAERVDFRPHLEDMVTVRGGGLYLPVRRRVGWMRGEPRPHPDWSIDTVAEEVIRGNIKKGAGTRGGTETVEGGYARYRANIFDETGRLIATGTKTEYSERFTDFARRPRQGPSGVRWPLLDMGPRRPLTSMRGWRRSGSRMLRLPRPGPSTLRRRQSLEYGLVVGQLASSPLRSRT